MEAQAAAVTQAYDTLKRPHTRAVHRLQRVGHPLLGTNQSVSCGRGVDGERIMDGSYEDLRIDRVNELGGDKALQTLRNLCVATSRFWEAGLEKAFEWTARHPYWNRRIERDHSPPYESQKRVPINNPVCFFRSKRHAHV
jgi:hypothetical protein